MLTVSFGPSSSMTSGSNIVFVPQFKKGDKGMKSKTNLANSKSFVRPHSRKPSNSKTTHVCHYCGVSRHILLITSSCIQISKCPNDYRFLLMELHLCLESY